MVSPVEIRFCVAAAPLVITLRSVSVPALVMSKLASVLTTSFATLTSNVVVLPMVDAASSVSVPVVRVTAVEPSSLMVPAVASRRFFVPALIPPTTMSLASVLSPIVMVPVEAI